MNNPASDPFKLLNLPRRFDLDLVLLDTNLRRLAAAYHPDQIDNGDAMFQQLQAAASLLRNPATRLRYLASVPQPSSMPLPNEATELFPKIISSLEQTDTIIAKYHAAQGSLAKAVMMQSLLAERNALTSAHDSVQQWQRSLHKKLQQLDSEKIEVTASQLLELANSFTFAQRWDDQLRERKVALETLLG